MVLLQNSQLLNSVESTLACNLGECLATGTIPNRDNCNVTTPICLSFNFNYLPLKPCGCCGQMTSGPNSLWLGKYENKYPNNFRRDVFLSFPYESFRTNTKLDSLEIICRTCDKHLRNKASFTEGLRKRSWKLLRHETNITNPLWATMNKHEVKIIALQQLFIAMYQDHRSTDKIYGTNALVPIEPHIFQQSIYQKCQQTWQTSLANIFRHPNSIIPYSKGLIEIAKVKCALDYLSQHHRSYSYLTDYHVEHVSEIDLLTPFSHDYTIPNEFGIILNTIPQREMNVNNINWRALVAKRSFITDCGSSVEVEAFCHLFPDGVGNWKYLQANEESFSAYAHQRMLQYEPHNYDVFYISWLFTESLRIRSRQNYSYYMLQLSRNNHLSKPGRCHFIESHCVSYQKTCILFMKERCIAF